MKFKTHKDQPVPSIKDYKSDSEWNMFAGDVSSVLKDLYRRVRTDLDNLMEWVHPIGSFYIQYPDADSNTAATAFPSAKAPATLFGGTWTEKWNTEGVFFRTQGDPYGEGETHQRTDGKQTDYMQGHIHTWVVGQVGYGATTCAGNTSWSTDSSGGPANDGTNGVPRTGKEIRPLNRLIIVWKRTA